MMKHYLELASISAKIHKRQSRITRICIALAVFLVTVIFGMADMEIRTQKIQTLQTQGSWHVLFSGINDEQAALIKARPQVENASWYACFNYSLDKEYTLNGTKAVVCGFNESFTELMPQAGIVEGTFPSGSMEAVFTKSVKERLGVRIGSRIVMDTPSGQPLTFTVSGFTGDTSMVTARDAFGVFMSTETYQTLFSAEKAEDMVLYVKFSPRSRISQVISDIREQLSLEDGQVQENTALLGLMGQSSDSYMWTLYLVAAILAVLVILAGVLMITGSLNSNVAQRTQFFGMLRCIGASRKQIIRFVRREALNWCKTAIPAGLAGGTVVVWALCALLKLLSPEMFSGMPDLALSPIALLSGLVIGVLTVLAASRAPAKRAARVSPLTAVSGNSDTLQFDKKATCVRLLRVDAALGVHHAVRSKKNLLLMTGSFAFSIILFLSFTTAIDFMHHALRPLQPYTPDISVVSPDNTCSISPGLLEQLTDDPSIKRIYGRMYAYNVPVLIDGQESLINLISYEEHQFGWAEKDLLEGSLKEAHSGAGVLTVYGQAAAASAGSIISADFGTGPSQLTVTGVLSDSPLVWTPDVGTVICSEELFRRLTGTAGYTILDIQLKRGASDADVNRICATAGADVKLLDFRMKNSEARGGSYSMSVFIYGFLAVIAMIAVFNIINSIAMSVSARMKQYGAMRAIGMGSGQAAKMIAAEALTYVASGIFFGTLAGLPLNKLLYEFLVTSRWGSPWYLPAASLCIIVIIVALSAALAIYGPVKRIRKMSIVEMLA